MAHYSQIRETEQRNPLSKLTYDRPHQAAPTPPGPQRRSADDQLLFVWLELQGTVSYTVRELAEQYSIRINQQWRVCFTWSAGDAHVVEIVDYH